MPDSYETKKIKMLQKDESTGQFVKYHPETCVDQVIESEEKKFLTAEKEEQYDDNTMYTNATPIVTPIGSITAGETFDNVPVKQMLDKILYPYVKPSITGSATPGSATREFGDPVSLTQVKAVVTKKSENISKVEFLVAGSVAHTVEDGTQTNGGTITYTPEPATEISTTTTVQVRATDAKAGVVTATAATYTFVYPFYHGVVEASKIGAMTSTDVTGLTKDISGKGTKTYTYTTNNNCMVVAYPASYGDLKSALDSNNFENIGSFTKQTLNVTGLDTTEQSYNVYVMSASTVSGFAMKFGF